jgi:hypothetical protein
MYCLQDLQFRWPFKVGFMYCLQDLQFRWPFKVGLMHCLQDLQFRWPVKVGLMYCLQDLQFRWPIKVGLIYCLQDLQFRWPINVGSMYCLQDLHLRWPVKAVPQGRSVLRDFKISAVTKLHVLLNGVRQSDIITAGHCSAAADRHDVTLLYLPSQTASELQLMDKSVLWLGRIGYNVLWFFTWRRKHVKFV